MSNFGCPKDCPGRRLPACHDHCTRYKEAVAQNEAEKKAAREEAEIRTYMRDHARDRRAKEAKAYQKKLQKHRRPYS